MLGEWSTFTTQDRAAMLLRFADALQKRATQISTTVSVQNGMPITLSEVIEAELPAGMFHYYASLAAGLQEEERRRFHLGYDTTARWDQSGSCGGIVTYNYTVLWSVI